MSFTTLLRDLLRHLVKFLAPIQRSDIRFLCKEWYRNLTVGPCSVIPLQHNELLSPEKSVSACFWGREHLFILKNRKDSNLQSYERKSLDFVPSKGWSWNLNSASSVEQILITSQKSYLLLSNGDLIRTSGVPHFKLESVLKNILSPIQRMACNKSSFFLLSRDRVTCVQMFESKIDETSLPRWLRFLQFTTPAKTWLSSNELYLVYIDSNQRLLVWDNIGTLRTNMFLFDKNKSFSPRDIRDMQVGSSFIVIQGTLQLFLFNFSGTLLRVFNFKTESFTLETSLDGTVTNTLHIFSKRLKHHIITLDLFHKNQSLEITCIQKHEKKSRKHHLIQPMEDNIAFKTCSLYNDLMKVLSLEPLSKIAVWAEDEKERAIQKTVEWIIAELRNLCRAQQGLTFKYYYFVVFNIELEEKKETDTNTSYNFSDFKIFHLESILKNESQVILQKVEKRIVSTIHSKMKGIFEKNKSFLKSGVFKYKCWLASSFAPTFEF